MAQREQGVEQKQSNCNINTALVVDDSKIFQIYNRRLLENHGIQTEVVGNGKEAVDVHSSGKRFGLIIMDRDMPVMDGIEATRKLREMAIRSTIVGVSSHSEQEAQEFVAAGLDYYQEKPLTDSMLESITQKNNPAQYS